MNRTTLKLNLNGEDRVFEIDPRDTLLDFLRETAGLTGTKEGCGKGECGACTVWLDGIPVNSCLVMAVQAEGRAVVTIEGLSANPRFAPLLDSMLECGGAQCGICTPGFVMSAAALLENENDPGEAQIRTALEGNLCRCTGYHKIFESVKAAAKRMPPRGEGR